MDLHHLKVFQTAARSLSFTSAGRQLSLSQSTVSLHMKQIEEEFGCLLFSRDRKRVALTEPGRVLLEHVDRIFIEYTNAAQAVGEFSNYRRGTIRLGVDVATLAYLMPPVLAHYRQKYPLIQILITSGTSEALLESLTERRIDLAVVMDWTSHLQSIDSAPLLSEEMVVVLSDTHPLAARAKLLPSDLEEIPLISHLQGTAMETLQQNLLARLGVQPVVAMSVEDIEAIKSLVRAKVGVALLPKCCVTGAQGCGLVQKRVDGWPMTRDLRIVVSDWRANHPATRRLARLMLRALNPSAGAAVSQFESISTQNTAMVI